jgi:hypothetical protein
MKIAQFVAGAILIIAAIVILPRIQRGSDGAEKTRRLRVVLVAGLISLIYIFMRSH